MKNIKIKAYCKINLSLKVLKKLKNGHHVINSIITFCDIHDVISISKIKGFRDKVSFYGKFRKGINRKSNTITEVLNILRKNNFLKDQIFKIKVKKNIPHGSGLGGGSSNAASLLNFLNLNMNLKLNSNTISKIAKKIGFDVPISLKKRNTLLIGNNGRMIRISKKFGLVVLIVYPNTTCLTKKIYKKNRKFSRIKSLNKLNFNNKDQILNTLKNESNDLENIVIKIYPKIKKLLDFIKIHNGCYFSRITGSGSACIGIFSNMKAATCAKKMISLKFPKYWCNISKTV